MRWRVMAQNSFFPDAIEHEAMKERTNAHSQNSLLAKDISLKTTQAFLITSYQLYRAILKQISDWRNFQCLKFSKFWSASSLIIVAPAQLI